MVIRARLKKEGGHCGCVVRAVYGHGPDRNCEAGLSAGNCFYVGHKVYAPWQELARFIDPHNYYQFFDMQFRAEGANLDLEVDGQDICHAQDDSIIAGAMRVISYNGVTLFQSIEARILDKTPASNEPAWVSAQVPKPGADGWIVLFDGKRLYGCSPPVADIASGKLSIQGGCLRLDSTGVNFNLNGRDVVIRARLKMVVGEHLGVCVRKDYSNGRGRDCGGYFNGGNNFYVGHHVDGPWANFAVGQSRVNYNGLFEMEFSAEGANLALRIDGQNVCIAQDSSIIPGAISVDAYYAIALITRIEARMLDKK